MDRQGSWSMGEEEASAGARRCHLFLEVVARSGTGDAQSGLLGCRFPDRLIAGPVLVVLGGEQVQWDHAKLCRQAMSGEGEKQSQEIHDGPPRIPAGTIAYSKPNRRPTTHRLTNPLVRQHH